MLRVEYILILPVHQGQTYSPENNIFFCITVDTYLLKEREGSEIRSKETRGESG